MRTHMTATKTPIFTTSNGAPSSSVSSTASEVLRGERRGREAGRDGGRGREGGEGEGEESTTNLYCTGWETPSSIYQEGHLWR